MDKIINIEDINNLTDIDLRDIFEDIDFKKKAGVQTDVEKEIDICPNCNTADNIIDDSSAGISVCKKCGQVIGSLMDSNPEWRQFDDDTKTTVGRCSLPISQLLPQSSLGTSIGGLGRSRIKTLHGWNAMPYKERSLNIVLKEIQYRCHKGIILKCIEDDAKIMYKMVSESKHLKGKNKGKSIIIRGANRKSLIAACIFFACRRKGETRSPKEIADIFEMKYTEITKGCKTFLKLMKIRKKGKFDLNMNSSFPEHFVTRFCKELKIKKLFMDQALQITKNIQKLNIASVHTPLAVATGSILLMADLNNLSVLTKRKIAQQFNVSEVTIAKAYKKILPYKNALIDDALTDKIVISLQKNSDEIIIPDILKKRLELFTKDDKEKIKNKIDKIANEEMFYDEFEEFEEFDDNIEFLDDDEGFKYEYCDINADLTEYKNSIDLDIYEQLNNTDMDYYDLMNNYS
ncbi:MAG: transcription initiation factor IIB [Edafosvirus sp.]|uniref:Transcription initiation factor IIB n=1 Tax=Edafosvirus sp. TaxID=2487765 RepID=A0A3G4ZV09_9VIRU|nr:MAG: transcription initiation factor IIB [Edafosvirus sp.]